METNYNTVNYDHINVYLRKGQRAQLQTIAEQNNCTVNELIKRTLNKLIENGIEQGLTGYLF